MNELFLFRLNRLASLAGQPLVRMCEGRYGITRREWRLILTLGRHGAMLSTRLAELARVEPARTSRAVSLLADKGLVLREPRPSDRRCIEIQLTDRGRAIFDELHPLVVDLDRRLLAGFDDAERRQLDHLFARLEQQAADFRVGLDLPKADRSRAARKRAGNP